MKNYNRRYSTISACNGDDTLENCLFIIFHELKHYLKIKIQ
jgi:Zn-dependent peptidase ImmA (M78 family)